MNDWLSFTCEGCGRTRRHLDTHLCPLYDCHQFACMHCWDAHLVLHELADVNYEDRIVRGYYESQVRKIAALRAEGDLFLPGKPASDS